MKINKAKERMHPERILEKQGRIRNVALKHYSLKLGKKTVSHGAIKDMLTRC